MRRPWSGVPTVGALDTPPNALGGQVRRGYGPPTLYPPLRGWFLHDFVPSSTEFVKGDGTESSGVCRAEDSVPYFSRPSNERR